MTRSGLLAGLLAGLLSLSACTIFVPSSRMIGTPMGVVTNLQPDALLGKWYEIGSFPVSFQEGCVGTTAEYTARTDGLIGVTNTCRIGQLDGPVRQIEGTARVEAPGRLRVNLDGVPFSAPYWVLFVSPDNRLLVVGVPSRAAGWVLSRDKVITPEQWRLAQTVFERNNYDIAALQRTKQR